MEILLQQLQITDHEALKAGIIDKVVVHQDDHYTFYIRSHHLLPVDDVNALLDHSSAFPYPCEFYFKAEEDYSEDEVLGYAHFIFHALSKKHIELSALSKDALSYKDGVLTIFALNDIQKGQLEEDRSLFEQAFHHFGMKIMANVKVGAHNKEFEAIREAVNSEAIVHVDKKVIEMATKSAAEPDAKPAYRGRSYKKDYDVVRIDEIDQNMRDVQIQGYIFRCEIKQVKNGKHLQQFFITDYTDSIMVKRWEDKRRNTVEDMEKYAKGGKWVRVQGTLSYDNFAHEDVITASLVEEIPAPKEREDDATTKRVELHLHSSMSTLDGVTPIDKYIDRAVKWGHKAIAVTDHGNVQSFPDAQAAIKGKDIKMIYGVELNMIDPEFTSVRNVKSMPLRDLTFVSFDLETTGLSQVDDEITEFGAVKISNGVVIDRFDSFVRSPKPINPRISELTSITNDDIKNAPTIQELMPKIKAFFGDDLVIGHNGRFDIGMLNYDLAKMGEEPIQNCWIDTLPLARHLIPLMMSYRLGRVCSYYKVPYDAESAHRADYDAEVLGLAFIAMVEDMKKRGVENVDQINDLPMEDAYKHAFCYHMTALAVNHDGLKNMFRIVSEASTKYFYRSDRIPRERLIHYRDGLLYGSSCVNSKVFEIAATRSEEELCEEIRFYDYIEIQPLQDAAWMVDRGKYESLDDIQRIYERIIKCAKKEGKLIVATGDVHFLDPNDKVYRDILTSNEKITINGRPHPLLDRSNPLAPTPDCYFRTTKEMLKCFPYLSDDECYEYVVTNTNKLADMIEDNIQVVKDKLYPPHIENVDEKFKDLCFKTAHDTYGEVLPTQVKERLEFEVDNIIKHGYAVIYYISALLVHASNDDGYLVGSRGSVGSSFAATMSGISEVNPLPPHYHCPKCKHTEFVDDIPDGFDLPDKKCPVCGTYMKADGHNIPFQTFLGFNGDKVPDIDLNFSGEYQPKAHEFVRKMFGSDHAFRAGTIATVAEKTAFGYAKSYAERIGKGDTIREAEVQRLADGCQGVKRTTGQHPAGIIVIPDDMEVFDFTPYQYPADDVNATWLTTHFDFHKIHDNVLKFDILGHVDPTVTRKLQDLTGVDPMSIPTNDPNVMSLFRTSEALGVDLTYLNCKSGALGLPEFGTRFVRSMLDQTQPKSFSDLVIISGLSHGTDVYLGNAEELIKTGTCTLSNVIGCRDDIMVYLISKGLPNKDAFDIMETTRKGKAPKVFPQRGYVELMKKHNVPQWYIDSCLKIKYMFPKAHAAAYVYSALRIAWWKVYYPREYYTVYFSVRCDAYEIETLIAGKERTWTRYQEILKLKQENRASNKDEALITVFEVAMEMFDRGYRFSNFDLYKSQASYFSLDPDNDYAIVPPFTSIDGLGASVGESVAKAREDHEFTSIEDLRKRTRLSNNHIDTLQKLGVLDSLNESDQLSLFDL